MQILCSFSLQLVFLLKLLGKQELVIHSLSTKKGRVETSLSTYFLDLENLLQALYLDLCENSWIARSSL